MLKEVKRANFRIYMKSIGKRAVVEINLQMKSSLRKVCMNVLSNLININKAAKPLKLKRRNNLI